MTRGPGTTLVIGVWGDGTSIVTHIVETLGDYFIGNNAEVRGNSRNKFGCREERRLVQALNKCWWDQVREMFLEVLPAEANGRKILVKMPWLLVRSPAWPLVEEAGIDGVVYTIRDEKANARDMHNSLHARAREQYEVLKQRWPGLEVRFENLLADPEREVRRIADHLGHEYKPEAAALVDPLWIRAERRKRGTYNP